MNISKKRDPRSWEKWRQSGAMGSPNFVIEEEGQLVYLRPLRPVTSKQIQSFYRSHRLRAASVDELNEFVDSVMGPKFDLGMAPIANPAEIKAQWLHPYASIKPFDPLEV